jgi:glycosyltransferase involved in cell wall biosynthesis
MKIHHYLLRLIIFMIPQRLKNFIRNNFSFIPFKPRLDKKLIYGFSQAALSNLDAISKTKNLYRITRVDNAFSLFYWHSIQGNFKLALAQIIAIRKLNSCYSKMRFQWLSEAALLSALGKSTAARNLILKKKNCFDSNAELLLANTWNSYKNSDATLLCEARIISHLNNIYTYHGLSKISKEDQYIPLSIDNITCVSTDHFEDHYEFKVSVIVTCFNSEKTIATALKSLINQTWKNLEILVVDDASTDRTAEIVNSFTTSDLRIKLIRAKINSGTYACRNMALSLATGEFITNHDSDDWSHSDKIRLQVQHLIKNKLHFTDSNSTRCLSNLYFVNEFGINHKLINLNFSSFLFPTEILKKLGGWDSRVRIAADLELYRRIIKRYNIKSPDKNSTLPDCPLSFMRLRQDSLIMQNATHLSTLRHGSRREYKEATAWWHRKIASEKDDLAWMTKRFSFRLPASINTRKDEQCTTDCFFIANLHSVNNMLPDLILHTKALGLGCALLHYPDCKYYEFERPLKDTTRDFAWENDISIVAPGEIVFSKLTIILDSNVFMNIMDRFPVVHFDELLVHIDYELREKCILTIKKNLETLFSNKGIWVTEPEIMLRIKNFKKINQIV